MRLLISLCLVTLTLNGCALWRFDPMSVYVRSEYIDSPEKEMAIVSKASLGWTEDGKIRVLHLKGTPYEMGFQQGYLLREEIQDNLNYLYNKAVDKFHVEELFDEVYERMRPHISQEYLDEMQGLAHGAKLPLRVVHGFHILPEIGEWGGKKKIKNIVEKMLKGELGTSCSNLAATGDATKDGKMYVVRILDWGMHRISKLHKYPLITVAEPNNGIPYANIGWAGFLGAISGINAEGITLGEMGYGDHDFETLHGVPMPFLLRDILSKAKNLTDVRKIISESAPTNSFTFLMSDGKTGEAEMYIRDPNRFLAFKPGTEFTDRDRFWAPVKNIVYGGHYREVLTNTLTEKRGDITVNSLMSDMIPKFAMPSNFQNVIYDPKDLIFWVNNAKSKSERAAEQPYTRFDLKKALIK